MTHTTATSVRHIRIRDPRDIIVRVHVSSCLVVTLLITITLLLMFYDGLDTSYVGLVASTSISKAI